MKSNTPMKTHISLNVSNLQRSLEFYRAFFGSEPHKVRPGYANFDLHEPALKISLNERADLAGKFAPAGEAALDHLGFQVSSAEELQHFKTRLQSAGLATFDETDATCCYARQDKIWAHDPDGNEWEIYLLTDDLEDDHSHNHRGELLPIESGCCAPVTSTPIVIAPAHRSRD